MWTMQGLDAWLRSSDSTPLVTRSLQTPPSGILVPRKRASHISGTLTLNTHSSIFSSYSFYHTSDMASRPLVRGEGSGSFPLGQFGSATLASVHRKPGGFSQDLRRHQADYQQTLGHGRPSKETGEGLSMGTGQWDADVCPRAADLYLVCRSQRAWHSLKNGIISTAT